jgi:ABC-type glycerol-3-phosphate transport system substrate-binding protein
MKQRRLWPAVVVMALALVGACGGDSGGGSSKADLTVWVDAARLPVAKAYEKANPDLKMDIVTFDGDGNGATTLQGKIQLWNRAGKGWPDVIFSEQVNDPIWMARKPFEFAAPVEDLIPE